MGNGSWRSRRGSRNSNKKKKNRNDFSRKTEKEDKLKKGFAEIEQERYRKNRRGSNEIIYIEFPFH